MECYLWILSDTTASLHAWCSVRFRSLSALRDRICKLCNISWLECQEGKNTRHITQYSNWIFTTLNKASFTCPIFGGFKEEYPGPLANLRFSRLARLLRWYVWIFFPAHPEKSPHPPPPHRILRGGVFSYVTQPSCFLGEEIQRRRSRRGLEVTAWTLTREQHRWTPPTTMEATSLRWVRAPRPLSSRSC
jgi:hypothetical protein